MEVPEPSTVNCKPVLEDDWNCRVFADMMRYEAQSAGWRCGPRYRALPFAAWAACAANAWLTSR